MRRIRCQWSLSTCCDWHQWFALARPVAVSLLLVFAACSSSRPARPIASARIVPAGSATGSTTAWRLTGQAESKNRCERMEPPVEDGHPRVDYPANFRRMGAAGTVVIEATVSGNAVPAAVKILRSTDRRLDPLALEAFRAWRYKPATCDGNPIDVYVTVTFSFSLKPDPGRTPQP